MLSRRDRSIVESLVLGAFVPLALWSAPLLGQAGPEVGTEVQIKANQFDIPSAKEVETAMATKVANYGHDTFRFLKWVETYKASPSHVLKVSLEGADDVYLHFRDAEGIDFHHLRFSNATDKLSLDQVRRRLDAKILYEFQNDDGFLKKIQAAILKNVKIASRAVLLDKLWVGIPLSEAGLGIQEDSEILVTMRCTPVESCIAEFKLHVVTGDRKNLQKSWENKVQGKILNYKFSWEGDDWKKPWNEQIPKVFKSPTSVAVYMTDYFPNRKGNATTP